MMMMNSARWLLSIFCATLVVSNAMLLPEYDVYSSMKLFEAAKTLHASGGLGAHAPTSGLGLDEKKELIATFINTTLDCTGINAVSAAFAVDGEVLFEDGFGLRDGKSKPATAHTNYAVASTTKAFTGALIVHLSEQGIIDLDKPIQEQLGEFALSSEFASKEATFKDLLSHQTGYPDHGYDSAWISGLSPSDSDELAHALSKMAGTKSFRSKFQYSNVIYFLAGWAAGKLGGDTWQNLVQKVLLDPLNMDETFFGPDAAMAASDDIASPFARGEELPMSSSKVFDTVCPCGCINSNAHDFIKWASKVTDWLRSGWEHSDMFQSWKTIDGMAFQDLEVDGRHISMTQDTYGAGWMLGSYNGDRWVSHGGNALGMTAEVTSVPHNGFSGVSFANDYGANQLLQALNFYAHDVLVDGKEPWMDGKKYCEMHGHNQRNHLNIDDKIYTAHLVGEGIEQCNEQVKPVYKTEAYVGTYSHPYYGDVVVEVDAGGELKITLSNAEEAGTEYSVKYFGCDNYIVMLTAMGQTGPGAALRFVFDQLKQDFTADAVVFNTLAETMMKIPPVVMSRQ